jgi:hypothetical protein
MSSDGQRIQGTHRPSRWSRSAGSPDALLARGPLTADDPVFVGRRGVRLTPRAVPGRSDGGDVFSLQRILGHSPASLQVDTTIRSASRR